MPIIYFSEIRSAYCEGGNMLLNDDLYSNKLLSKFS